MWNYLLRYQQLLCGPSDIMFGQTKGGNLPNNTMNNAIWFPAYVWVLCIFLSIPLMHLWVSSSKASRTKLLSNKRSFSSPHIWLMWETSCLKLYMLQGWPGFKSAHVLEWLTVFPEDWWKTLHLCLGGTTPSHLCLGVTSPSHLAPRWGNSYGPVRS